MKIYFQVLWIKSFLLSLGLVFCAFGMNAQTTPADYIGYHTEKITECNDWQTIYGPGTPQFSALDDEKAYHTQMVAHYSGTPGVLPADDANRNPYILEYINTTVNAGQATQWQTDLTNMNAGLPGGTNPAEAARVEAILIVNGY